MRVSCPKCKKAFSLPDEKVPAGRDLALVCPVCKGRFTISHGGSSVPPETAQGPADADPGLAASTEQDMSVALCCLKDPALEGKIRGALERMGYRLLSPSSPEEGIRHVRFSRFGLIIYQEGYDQGPEAGLWRHLSSLSGESRRNTFAVWIGGKVRTGDPMSALSMSADLVVNEKELDKLQSTLASAQEERGRFYRPFKQMLAELGLESMA